MRPHPPGVDGGRGSLRLHTDIPTRSEIERLLTARDDPCCVSIYLPTSPLTQDARAIGSSSRTSVGEALRQIEAAGADRRGIEAIREALDDLVDDDEFWAQQAHSLAVFATPAGARTFRLPNRPHRGGGGLGPLLRQAAAARGHLPAGGVRARAGRRARCGSSRSPRDVPPFEVAVPGLPQRRRERRRQGVDRRPLRRAGGSRAPRARRSGCASTRGRSTRRSARRSPGLELPLILARPSRWRRSTAAVNTYPHLASRASAGNPESATDDELAAAAREVLDALYAAELAELARALRAARAHGRGRRPTSPTSRARRPYGRGRHRCSSTSTRSCPGTSTRRRRGHARRGRRRELRRRRRDRAARAAHGRPRPRRARADVPGGGPLAAILRYAA